MGRQECDMRGKNGYFVVKQKAVPEVLLKVVEATAFLKELLVPGSTK